MNDYAGIALWTLDSPTPWIPFAPCPTWDDVLARLKARTSEGWALDPSFTPFVQGGRLFGNFLTLSASFNVAVPHQHYQQVLTWACAYLKTPLHHAAYEWHRLAKELKAIRKGVHKEEGRKGVGYGLVEKKTLERSTKTIARMRELDKLLYVKYLPTMNVPLPEVQHA